MQGLADYAGRLYAGPGMQELLLGLQDEAGQDVLLLLTACWLGRQQRAADRALWRRLQDCQRPWRQQVIQPLRQVRRTLADSDGPRELYEQVKACELAAEWHQLAVLERLCADAPRPAAPLRECVLAHLAYCCNGLEDGRLQQLAAAA